MKNNQPDRNTPTENSGNFVIMDNGRRFYLWVIGISPSSYLVSNDEKPTSDH